MADFHLGQHPLFRKHAYTVPCHPAPGAPQRPTLPLRGGPPFCSVLKMISMHEFSWGAMSSSLYRAFQFGCFCGWVCLRLCIRGACMCESAHSHPCFQMGVSLVSGVSMIGRRRRMPSPSVKMRCTVYAESACSVWSRLLHCQQCTHCDIKPQDRNIEGLVCAQDTIKHSTHTHTHAATHSTRQRKNPAGVLNCSWPCDWCTAHACPIQNAQMITWNPRHRAEVSVSDSTHLTLDVCALWCCCTKNVKGASFRCLSVCLSSSLSETRDVVAIETIWRVWTVSFWYSFHHIEPLFLSVLLLFYPSLFLLLSHGSAWILLLRHCLKRTCGDPHHCLVYHSGGLSVQLSLLPLLSSEGTQEVLFSLV